MAGPATALLPVDSTVRAGLKALTGDLVTFRGQVFRLVEYETGEGEKHAFLAPVDVEVHVSPLSILLGLGAAAVGAVASTVAWHGLSFQVPGGPVFTLVPGIKDTALGKDLTDFYTRYRSRKSGKAILDRLVEEGKLDPGLASGDPCVLSEALWNAETNATLRDAYREKARRDGCAWAQ